MWTKCGAKTEGRVQRWSNLRKQEQERVYAPINVTPGGDEQPWGFWGQTFICPWDYDGLIELSNIDPGEFWHWIVSQKWEDSDMQLWWTFWLKCFPVSESPGSAHPPPPPAVSHWLVHYRTNCSINTRKIKCIFCKWQTFESKTG